MADEEKQLAVRDAARTPDPYEEKYMGGEGMVLHRAKERAPWQLNALLGVGFASSLLPLFLGAPGAWIAPLIALPIMFVTWMLFSVLRVTVSQGYVNIQYGLFGPKIPIASISKAEATTYDWKKFGGWGIKRSWSGEWIYNMPGDGGKAVRIEWTNDKGKSVVTLIGSKEPQTLAAAIAQARANPLPASKTKGALPPG